MKEYYLKASIISVLLLSCIFAEAAPVPVPKVMDCAFYPLKIGTEWVYKIRDVKEKLVMRVARHEKRNRVYCAAIEVVSNGKVIETEYVEIRKDGVYAHTFNGHKSEPPFRILMLPPRDGNAWKIEAKCDGQIIRGNFTMDKETITVPAGKFQTVATRSKNLEIGGQKFVSDCWFASGVGIVKQRLRIGVQDMIVELESVSKPRHDK